jgi:REP element-mobilizing transposase RayT
MQSRFPAHVTVRVRRELPWLRRFHLANVLQRAFVRGCDKGTFRISQFSIQGNHIHLICEARDSAALARGMQSWAVRVARGINRNLARSGSVFDDRYHCELLKTPRQTRNALCYVLHNARRHGERLDRAWRGVDPFSSAWWFDGWKDERWRRYLRPAAECSVASARSFLLTRGWRRYGLIGLDEVPARNR